MASSTPSAILSDAITSLSHAATLALTTVEDQARLDVARATSETRQARNQRDEALNSLRAAEMGQSNHKQQLDGWKTAVEKADLTIKHQAETISQLRDETVQWKDQFARLEKTCQQWKDQFLRVERERYRLSARLEELVSDQLSHANGPSQQYYHALNTKHHGEPTELATASTSTKRASTSSDQKSSKGELVEPDGVPPSQTKSYQPHKATANQGAHRDSPSVAAAANTNKPPQKSVRSRTTNNKPTKQQQSSVVTENGPRGQIQVDSASASHRSRTQVIRRVQAVIEVPIKTEDREENPQYNQEEPDGEGEQEVPRQARKLRTNKPAASTKKVDASDQSKDKERAKSKSWQVWRDEEYRTPLTNAEDDQCQGSGDSEENDDDDSYGPRRRNPQRKKIRRNLRESESGDSEDEDDDEDELIMGADDNQEVYGTRSFPPGKLKSKNTKSVPSHAACPTRSLPAVPIQKQPGNPRKRKAAPGVSDDDGKTKSDAKVTRRR